MNADMTLHGDLFLAALDSDSKDESAQSGDEVESCKKGCTNDSDSLSFNRK